MIFIDTGAFLARYLERDQYHVLAVTYWQQLLSDSRRCITSNFVLDETLTLLARRSTYAFAADRAETLLHSKALVILRPELEDEKTASGLFRKYADQSVSFTDCVSFVLMRKYRLQDVFTFDWHFQYAGFSIEPQRQDVT